MVARAVDGAMKRRRSVANPSELPDLVGEFVDLSKEYLRQEALEPTKQLGRFAGFSLAAGSLFALAALFLSVAWVRVLIDLLPEGRYEMYYQGLGYVLAALSLGAVAAMIVGMGSRDSGEGS
jgi:hypothetical protein